MSTESTLWRQRAAADRNAAEAEPLANARERLETSAASYDKLASHAEGADVARAKRLAAKAAGESS